MSRDRNSSVYVGNLPADFRSRDLEQLFEKYGRIRFVDIKSRPARGPPFAFVEYEGPPLTRGSGPRGPGGRPTFGGGERSFRRDFGGRGSGRRGYKVFISGLPTSGSWQDLKDHFREFGDVLFADVTRNGDGVVEFAKEDDAKYAIKKMRRYEVQIPRRRVLKRKVNFLFVCAPNSLEDALLLATVGTAFRFHCLWFRIRPHSTGLVVDACGQQNERADRGDLRTADRRRPERSAWSALYPWAVTITLFVMNNLGGVIISPLHILTAAHPFIQFDRTQVGACVVTGYKTAAQVGLKRVVLGDDCVQFARVAGGGRTECEERHVQMRNIRSVAVDRGFADGRCVRGHDWAIVEVDRPLVFDERIAPICLPRPAVRIADRLTAVSWGRPAVYISSGPLVREIPLRYDPTCTAPSDDFMPTKVEDFLCATAWSPRRRSQRICHGDSGTGLQQAGDDGRSVVVGVTSFGSEGCPLWELARFTRVSAYLDDICALTGVCYSIET
ncbi:Peptidase S1 domain-containing protein [Aphelenchoides fujianensis]|nr:Peptidase S1 domain-containing protein [Aphelenchoides fujianensis]